MTEVSVLTVSKRTGWELAAQKCLEEQTFKDFHWVVVSENELEVPYIPAPPKTKVSNLNASLNEGLRKCKGSYVVFYQDFIELEPDTIERLMELVNLGTFVTTLTKNAEGEKEDLRYLGVDCPRPCTPEEWEANVAVAPMKAIKELGGFDEDYDNGWSWDNVNLAQRAEILGYRFILDESNRPQLLYHPKERSMEPNGEFHAQVMRDIKEGKKPLKCSFLL